MPGDDNYNGTEILVGLVVFIGILYLTYVSIGLGKWHLLGADGYVVYADFVSASGLNTGDPVEAVGVEIGNVESISLAPDYQARLRLRIKEGVTIYEDAIAFIEWEGLVGDRSVSIDPGNPPNPIEPGDEIEQTRSQPSLQDLVGKLVAGDLLSRE
jgi:phospholipid/cholesterol/gamma-HCH transport system substrate-binding protein